MLKRKDLAGFITNYQAEHSSVRRWDSSTLYNNDNPVDLISKRVKTEPENENRNYISYRLSEIKNKYSSRREAPLGEISCEGLRNINNVKIKEVDSPISFLQKSHMRPSNYYSNKDISFQSRKISEKHELRSNQTDPRIQSIDKINLKIKNILKTIEGSQREYSSQRPTSVSKQTTPTYQNSNSKSKQIESTELTVPTLKTSFHRNIPSYRDSQSFSSKLRQQLQSKNQGPTYIRSQQQTLRSRPTSQWSNAPIPPAPFERPKSNYDLSSLNHQQTISRQSIGTNDTFEESIVINKPLEDQQTEGTSKARTELSRQSSYLTLNGKKETKRLFAALKRQVQLDEEYRNKKYAFKQIREDNKVEKLMNELIKIGVEVGGKQVLATSLNISEEQYNPFYTCREDSDYISIAEAYKDAHQHWQNSILHKFNFRKLTEEGFSQKSVDLDRKGYLIVEDLVRMLNLQADTFVRNRDLVLIYRRLGAQKVLFSCLMRKLCAQV